LTLNIIVTLKSALQVVVQGYWNWYHSTISVWFLIRLL